MANIGTLRRVHDGQTGTLPGGSTSHLFGVRKTKNATPARFALARRPAKTATASNCNDRFKLIVV